MTRVQLETQKKARAALTNAATLDAAITAGIAALDDGSTNTDRASCAALIARLAE